MLLKKLLLTMIVLISSILLLLNGCASEPYVVEPKPSLTNDRVATIFVVSHGWHTGVIMPTELLKTRLPQLAQRFNHTSFIEIGWGDKGFYQSKEVTTELTLRAMFWSSGSVVHVVAVSGTPACYFRHSEMIELYLTQEQLDSLVEFIDHSFARNQQGEVISLKQGIYGDSQFYEGVGRYHLMNTCNKWTAKALKSSGVNLSTAFKLTSDSVMNTLKQQPHTTPLADERTFCQ